MPAALALLGGHEELCVRWRRAVARGSRAKTGGGMERPRPNRDPDGDVRRGLISREGVSVLDATLRVWRHR
jgi:hypothetical protein